MKHVFLSHAASITAAALAAIGAVAAEGRPDSSPARPPESAAPPAVTGAALPRITDTAAPPAAVASAPKLRPAAIPTTISSYFAATNWAQRLDWLHDMANAVSEQDIKLADSWFITDPANRVPFKSAKFRLGLQVEMDYNTDTNSISLRPLIDTESEVHMPNAERRLRLTISTLDPTALPGQDSNQGMGGFRVGLKHSSLLKDVETSFGVRLQWLPSVYTHIAWDPCYPLYSWQVYPEQKVGWDSDDGMYETTSLMLNRWVNRWMIRPIASLKLSRSRYKDDWNQLDQERQDAEAAGLPPPDGNYCKGWDWEFALLGGYAYEMFDETVYGRLADGSDVAHGGGFRFMVLGGLHIVESYNLTFLYRDHLYKKWLYYLIKPNVSWQHDNEWTPNYSLTLGIDILLYGTKER